MVGPSLQSSASPLPCHACVSCVHAKSLESDISLQSHYRKTFSGYSGPITYKHYGSNSFIFCVIDYITQKTCLGNYFCSHFDANGNMMEDAECGLQLIADTEASVLKGIPMRLQKQFSRQFVQITDTDSVLQRISSVKAHANGVVL